nr:sulfatase-like hydrolase/transferase [uncultured Gellertiella sp.]
MNVLSAMTSRHPLLVYYSIVALGFLGVAVCACLANRTARFLFGVVISVSLATEFTLYIITGHTTEIQTYQALMEAREHAGGAVFAYLPFILQGVSLLILALPGLVLSPIKPLQLHWRWSIVPLSAFAVTYSGLHDYADKMAYIPAPFATIPKLVLAVTGSQLYFGPREEVHDHTVRPGAFEKIVFIVDESVRGDYLQINNPAMDNTPFLASETDRFANFGLAVSYADCSAASRLALRAGTHLEDLPDLKQVSMHQPTFWQYAKKAGYQSIYLNGFGSSRVLHSFQSFAELAEVDRRENADLSDMPEADNKIADRLATLLKQPGKAFIFVEKLGTHAKYSTNFPKTVPYSPRHFARPLDKLPADQASDIMDYSKSTWWRVDEFFRRLLPALEEPDVLTIYTSDHGQSMYEGGYPATHCTVIDPVSGEGIVPLLVFTGNAPVLKQFRDAAGRYKDRAMHADIPGTLYTLMGFDPLHFARPYTTSLLQVPLNRHRRFFGGTFYSADIHWHQVD